ncbi:FMN-binding domain protein [Gottschalkia purinilytica]|uniref:FMN-binding domain protein n=1 Tax=Gottschalkia purinilytica TaxID=1503 RepID=A0A0L0WA91_GOTPU|nr:4Fe-4S binding protein [Gottschalkia purinilytica]KNF08347.1 FMN-binding domain protein [Gottschalkia purinilytica]
MINKLKKRQNIQIFFFITLFTITISKTMELNILPDRLNALNTLCPIGGVVNTVDFFTGGMSLLKEDGLIILGSILITLILGPIFCGWLCPFGAFQEFIYKISSKLFPKSKRKLKLSEEMDKKLSVLRYILLLLVIILTVNGYHLILSTIDPTYSLLYIPLGYFNALGITLFIFIIVIGIFIERAWCKYLCPYGALLGILNKLKIFKITRKDQTCIGCTKCNRKCPMAIDITKYDEVNNLKCVSCMECIEDKVCPSANTLILESSIKNKKIEKYVVKEVLLLWLVLIFIIPFYNDISNFSNLEESQAVRASTDNIVMKNNGSYKDGEYIGKAKGYKSIIKVKVKIQKGKIIEVKIISHDETESYAKKPVEIIPNQIIEKQSTDVDVVSGATWTSDAIKNAVNDALIKSKK